MLADVLTLILHFLYPTSIFFLLSGSCWRKFPLIFKNGYVVLPPELKNMWMEQLDHVVRWLLTIITSRYYLDIKVLSFHFFILFDPLQEAFRTPMQHCVTSMSSHAVWKFSGSVVTTTNKHQNVKGLAMMVLRNVSSLSRMLIIFTMFRTVGCSTS